MSSGMNKASTITPARKRGPQQRAEETRNALIETAVEMFTSQGFDGVSIRMLESTARVQRGAVAYHFESKEALWKASVEQLVIRFGSHIDPLITTLQDLDGDARLRAIIAAIVRFSAETPEFNRLMVQEGRANTWRLQFLMDAFIRTRLGWFEEMVGILNDPHAYYMIVGSATLVFDVEHECQELFGVDPTDDAFIREHASHIADMIIYLRSRNTTKSTEL